MSSLRKISRVSGTPDRPVEHPFEYANTFVRESTTNGPDRLKIGLRAGHAAIFSLLGVRLQPPYRLLYVLHTSLQGSPLGRYESSDLGPEDIEAFVERFGGFIAQDARHDVWLHSRPDGGPIVLDRYNMAYAYGQLERLASFLSSGGVQEVATWAAPAVPYPHALHYHPEFNALEAELLDRFDWVRTPLRDRDVQFWSGPQAS